MQISVEMIVEAVFIERQISKGLLKKLMAMHDNLDQDDQRRLGLLGDAIQQRLITVI